MARNLLQDMVKIKKKVQNPVSKFHYASIQDKFSTPQNIIEQKSSDNKSNKYKLWFVALFSVVFLFFALSFLFAKAKIVVIPKTQNIALDQNLSAVKESNVAGILPFNLVVISGEENKIVPEKDTEDFSATAKGQVTIYNSFSSAPQTLSKDTKLEGSNGKIYKTVSRVVVPGMSKKGTPGAIGVAIYGNASGEEYNSIPLDFTILGFKGTSKYTKFKVRSQGAITGGMKGKYYKPLDTDKDLLSDKLLVKATNQIPPGFILFKDAVFLTIKEDSIHPTSSVDTESGMIKVVIQGTLYGFLFDEKKLTKIIAQNVVEKYDGSDIHIPDIKNLTFSLSAQAGLSSKDISFTNIENINFNLSGSSKIVWDVDSSKLVADLLGKRKKDFTQILSTYTNITSADVTFRPFWKMSFPEKEKNIELIIDAD